MAASTPGSGRPIEPGLMSIAGVLAIMMPPVSVCHQLSWIGSPSASSPHHDRLGVERLADAGDEAQRGKAIAAAPSSAPAFISMRIAVGAVYQTVTPLAPRRMRYQRSASKSASSTMLVTPCSSGAMMP